MTESDRRQGKRVVADLLCTLVMPNGVKHSAMARNLSAGGAFIECDHRQLKPGDRVEVSFNVPRAGRLHRVETRSEVVHGPARVSMTAFGFGLHFVDVDGEHRVLLEEYIEARPELI